MKRFVVGLCVFLVSLVGVGVALANPYTINGRLEDGDPTWDRPNCGGQTITSNVEWYDIYSFSVTDTAAYTFAITATSDFEELDTYLVLYEGGFNPTNPLNNCIADDDDGNGGPAGLWSSLTASLTPGKAYTIVVTQCCDGLAPSEEGNYTLTISGGGITFGNGDVFNPGDSRINTAAIDRAAPVAIYCQSYGIQIYTIDPGTGRGSLLPVISLSYEAIEAAGIPASANLLLAEEDGVQLWRLTTGEFQVNTRYQQEWKDWAFVWDQCPNPTRSYHPSN
jgi:hypothetical protein